MFSKVKKRYVFFTVITVIIVCAVIVLVLRSQQSARNAAFTITFSAFDKGVITDTYTCDGEGKSIPLIISGYPEGTKSFGLVFEDTNAENAIHWLMWDIPLSQASVIQGVKPDGTIARSYDGNFRYAAVCPPKGETHTYRLSVYAFFQESLKMGSGTITTKVKQTLQKEAIAVQSVTADYTRRP